MFFVKCHIFEGDEIKNRMEIAWSVEYQFWFRGKILDDLHRKFNCEVEHTLYRLLLLRIRNMHIPLFLSDGVLNFFNDFSEGKTLYNYLPLSSLFPVGVKSLRFSESVTKIGSFCVVFVVVLSFLTFFLSSWMISYHNTDRGFSQWFCLRWKVFSKKTKDIWQRQPDEYLAPC